MPIPSILIVEDERIVARDLATTLERAGYYVAGLAASGEQAVQKAIETRPDVILMDVRLAGELNGIEAAGVIRRQAEIPVIYLTANGDNAILERAKTTEPIAFILKPYEERELLTTIEIALHQYQSQQERAQSALRESELRFRQLFESARDGIALTDLAGLHFDCNPAYLHLFGYDQGGELSTRNLTELTAPEFRGLEASLIEEEVLPAGYSREYEKECLRKDGSRVVVEARLWLRRDGAGRPLGLWVRVQNISKRKQAEARILEYQAQLRSLMAELSLTEERERQRIATDIHDRISQALAVCQMRLEALVASVRMPAVSNEIDAVCRLLERSLQDTSNLMFELSPPVLHQLGLAAALEWFSERLQTQHNLAVQLTGDSASPTLTSDQRIALFRGACELMNNVVKHARATRLKVDLHASDGMCFLTIEDDGQGFDPQELCPLKRPHGGFGLFHVRERLRAWEGDLEIRSSRGTGTSARLTMPIHSTHNTGPSPRLGEEMKNEHFVADPEI